MINSNLDPIFYRFATIHPLQTDTTFVTFKQTHRAIDAYSIAVAHQ